MAKNKKIAIKLIIFDYYKHIEKLIFIIYPYKIVEIWMLAKLIYNYESKQKYKIIKKI